MLEAKTKQRILIVDDDEDILELLCYNLSKEGYVVEAISDSANAISTALAFKPDLAILDLMMHPYNGIDICRYIRRVDSIKEMYVFFLTAKSDDYYEHAVYNVGGDEFVEKIVGLKPLIAKVNSVLRKDLVIRKRLTRMKAGGLELFRGVETVYNGDDKIVLSKAEFDILFLLAQNAGKRISITQMISTLWGSRTFMDEITVHAFIKNLKKKIGEHLIIDKGRDTFTFNSSPNRS